MNFDIATDALKAYSIYLIQRGPQHSEINGERVTTHQLTDQCELFFGGTS